MTPKISFIVTIFNSEATLSRCIHSILNQKNITDFEIILVNDGSIDGSEEICKKSIKKDNRIKYFYQINKGVSTARKMGFNSSKGEYIAFVDSDDELDLNFASDALLLITKNSADIIIGGIEYIYSGKIKKNYISNLKTENSFKIFQKDDINFLISNLLEDNQLKELENCKHGGIYSKLFKREIISDVEFDENLFRFEDIFYNLKCFLKAKKIIVSKKIWYKYYQYPNSSIRKNGIRILNNNFLIMNLINKNALIHNISKKTLYNFYLFLLYDAFRINFNKLIQKKFRENFKKELKIIIKDPLWEDLSKNKFVVSRKYSLLTNGILKKNVIISWFGLILIAVFNFLKKYGSKIITRT